MWAGTDNIPSDGEGSPDREEADENSNELERNLRLMNPEKNILWYLGTFFRALNNLSQSNRASLSIFKLLSALRN